MFHPETYFREELCIGTKRLKSCVGEKEEGGGEKDKKQNILQELLLCSELQLLDTGLWITFTGETAAAA